MESRRSLTQRVLRWLVAYAVMVSAIVATGGYVIHERVERLAWESLLRAELGYYQQRRGSSPEHRWQDTETLRLLGAPGSPPLPPSLAALPDGLHDDLTVDGVHSTVLRDRIDGRPVALALDLTQFDSEEGAVIVAVAGGTIVMILVLGLAIMWRMGRVVAPLSEVAGQVARLQPGRAGRVAVPASAGTELAVIADAFNGYLERNAAYVERERAFLGTASHELRTPIAVMRGAAELLQDRAELPPLARAQVARIARMAAEVEELITLLLMLARDPARLAQISEPVSLHVLLPQLVEDHRHLTGGKDLTLRLEPTPPTEILAPLAIVKSAIGNLLRNSIEHSDSGEIRIQLLPDAVVVVEDPGHGMSAEQVSEIYGRLARGDAQAPVPGTYSGIGIDLISRLCEHLGWRLEIDSNEASGTVSTLHLASTGVPLLQTSAGTTAPRAARR